MTLAADHPRGSAPAVQLARLGFHDPARAERLLGQTGLSLSRADTTAATADSAAVIDALSATADPDLALLALSRLAEASAVTSTGASRVPLVDALRRSPALRQRLIDVLGASTALGEHLIRHPADVDLLAADQLLAARPTAVDLQRILLRAVGADAPAPPPTGTAGARARGTSSEVLDALRTAYRRCLLQLAARDLAGTMAVDDVAAELADLAGAALTAALAIAAAGLPAAAEPCQLAVIGMGKCGGRELNYVSDVDVIFVAEPVPGGDEAAALHSATALAAGLMRACSTTTPEGALWPVDAALRPEGKSGPLVRTLASHAAYYERWAKTWEFQALLKARPVAGDLALGRAFCAAVAPLVWTAGDRPNFVEDVQAMRRRVESSLPAAAADRELKLGPGGLRDVEFAVQLLQLVHGRADEELRSPTTLVALQALANGGYVGREDARKLAESYRYLRQVEHRLQLQPVLHLAQVAVGLGQLAGVLAPDVPAVRQRLQRDQRGRAAQFFVGPAVHQLQQLDGELYVPQPSRTKLELPVGCCGRQRALYPPAHGLDVLDEVGPVPRRPHQRRDGGAEGTAQSQVPGHRPRLEQRLELPGLGPALVVRRVTVPRAHQRAELALRAQPGVDRPQRPLRGGGRAGPHQPGGQRRGRVQRRGFVAAGYRLGDEDDVHVADVIEFATAALAHPDYCQLARLCGGRQSGRGDGQSRGQRRASEVGQLRGDVVDRHGAGEIASGQLQQAAPVRRTQRVEHLGAGAASAGTGSSGGGRCRRISTDGPQQDAL